MKLIADIQGDIRAMMKQELEAAERAVTAGVSEAASGLQTAWRGQITDAALGQGLANSIRKTLYPTSGASIRAAAVIYSHASQVVDAVDRGGVFGDAEQRADQHRLTGGGDRRGGQGDAVAHADEVFHQRSPEIWGLSGSISGKSGYRFCRPKCEEA